MTDKNIIACPACEYEKGSIGQPVEYNGQMKCLDCGSSWRVFGTLQETSLKQKDAKNIKTRTQILAEQVSLNTNEVFEDSDVIATKAIKRYQPGFATFMSCFAAFLLFAGLYAGTLFLGINAEPVVLDKLNIAEVKVEEQVRRSGEKVFTVKGLVSNPTDLSKPIPPIMIVLRQQNGQEITRWHYNSSLVALKAGGKSYFASSIQYDTPTVAYAEAVFK